jgi:nitroreductase
MFLSLIQKRRSIRKFQNKAVESEKIDMITEAMLRAPSSRGINPWEFILIDHPDTIDYLSKTKKHGSSFLKNAPFAIVILGDIEKSDMWIEDTSISATYIQLAAEDIGLSSCWIQIRNRPHDENHSGNDYVAEHLNIPEQYQVTSIIAIGYPDEQKEAHKKEHLQTEKIHLNQY